MLKKKILKGFLWSFVGKFTYIIIGFLANIFLARMLIPEEIGRVGIAMTFVVIANVLSESGFSGALVRKLDVKEKDFSTAFIFNLLISILLYIVLFFSAELISIYYRDSELEKIIKVSSLVIIINAFSMVQNARANIALAYKKITNITTLSIIFSSILGVFLAFKNFGVWSIVTMQLANAICLTILFWISFGTLKRIEFSRESFRYLLGFGSNTTIALFLNRFFDSVYQLIIGRFFSMANVGLYYQAKKIQDVPLTFISSVSSSVIFASLSKIQNDKSSFHQLYSQFVLFLAVFSCLITAVIYTYSTDIINLIYGEKWLRAVPYMEILIIASFFYSLETFNRLIFKTYNKTKKILILEIIKKIFQSVTIVIGIITKDILILLYGYVLTNIFSYLLNLYFAKRIITLLDWKEAYKVFKIVIYAGILCFIFKYFIFSYFYQFVFRVAMLPVFVILYFLLLKYFNIIDVIFQLKKIQKLIKN